MVKYLQGQLRLRRRAACGLLPRERVLLYRVVFETAPVAEAQRYFYELFSGVGYELGVLLKELLSERELYNHSTHVSVIALTLGIALQLPEESLALLGVSGLFHDIGKTAWPRSVLHKVGDLDNLEWGIVRAHPQHGYKLLLEKGAAMEVARLVLEHHERLDGSGYPRGLKRGELHPLTPILAAADVYEALTSARAYRGAYGPEEALAIMMGTPAAFDEKVLAVLEAEGKDLIRPRQAVRFAVADP